MDLNKLMPFSEVIENQMNKLEGRLTELVKVGFCIDISTGFHDLDKMLTGLREGMYIIGGGPDMKVDVLLRNIMEISMLTADYPVVHFECKMSEQGYFASMMSGLSRVHRLKTMGVIKIEDEDWERLSVTQDLIKERGKLLFSNSGLLTFEKLEMQIDESVKTHGGISMITINSMQMLRLESRPENRYTEMAELSRNLKVLAKKYGVPVLVASSLSRKLESRVDKRPLLSDLRDSGTIEDDADVVLLVHHEEVYNADTSYKDSAEIIIAKNTMGPKGWIRLSYQDEYSRYDNYCEPANDEY